MCAQDWGITPWMIEDAPVLWFERWKYVKIQTQLAVKNDNIKQ